MKPPDPLHVTSREEWRAWLAAHYATETEVWLVYNKKHTGKPRVSYDEAVEEALCFGWIDSTVHTLDEDRFAQKFTPRKDARKWSALNLERMARLIAEGRMTEAGLAKFDPRPETPRFESGDPLPGFLEQALREHPAAQESFLALAPSHRREYIRWVTEAKREETRQRRLREAIERLERNQKLGMK